VVLPICSFAPVNVIAFLLFACPSEPSYPFQFCLNFFFDFVMITYTANFKVFVIARSRVRATLC